MSYYKSIFFKRNPNKYLKIINNSLKYVIKQQQNKIFTVNGANKK